MSILKNLKNLFSNKNKIENNIVDNVFIELARDTSYFVGINRDSYLELGHIYGIVERHYKESGIKLNYKKRPSTGDYECIEILGTFLNVLVKWCKMSHRDFKNDWYTNEKFIKGKNEALNKSFCFFKDLGCTRKSYEHKDNPFLMCQYHFDEKNYSIEIKLAVSKWSDNIRHEFETKFGYK